MKSTVNNFGSWTASYFHLDIPCYKQRAISAWVAAALKWDGIPSARANRLLGKLPWLLEQLCHRQRVTFGKAVTRFLAQW